MKPFMQGYNQAACDALLSDTQPAAKSQGRTPPPTFLLPYFKGQKGETKGGERDKGGGKMDKRDKRRRGQKG